MKYYFYFLLFILNSNLFSSTSDSTLKFDMNFDGIDENIKFIHSEIGPEFELWINNAVASDTFSEGYSSRIQIIDIDRNDNLREIVVTGSGSSDQEECFLFQFIDGKVISCGYLGGSFGISTKGNNILYENSWMGFWGPVYEYDFDSENKKLTKIEKEFYSLNEKADVTIPFPILTHRYDQSPVAVIIKVGTKITFIKADLSPLCKTEYDYVNEVDCDWYLIRTDDGTEGWCRLKDFRDNVDGLIWAG